MQDDILNSLKQSREKAGLTQKDVESELDMRALTMRDYEIGRLKLPVNVALDLAKLYGVTVDELIGHNQVISRIHQSKVLVNFKTLFVGNSFNVMFLDPILKAFLEDKYENHFDISLFELLTKNFSEKKKKNLVLEINKFLLSLAGIDNKIADEEIECIKYLLFSFGIQNKFKEISLTIKEDYLPAKIPEGMENVEMRHFIIWILLFFAHADGNLCYQEIAYIEKCAECLKVNRSNFIFIKSKFISEGV